jgi:hypothetical protein
MLSEVNLCPLSEVSGYGDFAFHLSKSSPRNRPSEARRVVRRRGSHILLDNRLTDGDEVASLTRRPPFTPRKIPGTHFY